MAQRDLSNAFDDCIDRLNSGETLESCLRVYPQYGDELRAMLMAGQAVVRARYVGVEVQAAQARGRERLRAAMQRTTLNPPRPVTRTAPFMRLVTLAAAFLLVMGVFLGGAALAAESSLPGDPLYGLKRVTEDVRLGLVGNEQPLQEQFAQRRVNEVRQLLAIQRAESVDFSGEVQVIDDTQWQIAGLSLTVPDGTPGSAGVKVSDDVAVRAHTTADGSLSADQITLIEAGIVPPTPTPTPTHTETPTPSQTPTSTPTPTPTVPAEPPNLVSTACVPAVPEGWVSYRIRSGDTLSHLAAQTGITLQRLMEVNCLTNASLIVLGEVLFLPFEPAPASSNTPVPTPVPAASGSSSDGSGSSDDSSHEDDNSGHSSDDDHEDDHSGSSDNSGSGGGSHEDGED